jgi:hypothetical protein
MYVRPTVQFEKGSMCIKKIEFSYFRAERHVIVEGSEVGLTPLSNTPEKNYGARSFAMAAHNFLP